MTYKWLHKFQNYRDAKSNEINCESCRYSFYVWYKKKLRCGNVDYHQSVGKNKTCDYAKE